MALVQHNGQTVTHGALNVYHGPPPVDVVRPIAALRVRAESNLAILHAGTDRPIDALRTRATAPVLITRVRE